MTPPSRRAPRGAAFVTGASRGIGKATAVALAEAGFDVAIAARSLREGERFEHSSTLRSSDTSPMPGSLEETARLVQQAGTRAVPVRLDLLEPASLASAVDHALRTLGRIDLLVNNAVYTGPGNMDRMLDLPSEVLQRILEANVTAPTRLTQLLLPGMLERRHGVVVNVTSHVAEADPRAGIGAGGWGFAYAASKGAFHRMAGILAVEHADAGVRFHNLDPGFVVTEMMERQHRAQGFGTLRGAPPAVPAAVIRWLATAPDAEALNGRTLRAQPFCREHALLPDWS